MALIPWEPLRDIDKFLEEDWDFMPVVPFRSKYSPQVDVSQDKKNVYVDIPLAGIKPEDIDISIEENLLVVKGKSEEEKEEKKKDYFHKEIRKGSFERSVYLPAKVKENKVNAEFKNGMLKIVLPKVVEKKSKKVKIKIKK